MRQINYNMIYKALSITISDFCHSLCVFAKKQKVCYRAQKNSHSEILAYLRMTYVFKSAAFALDFFFVLFYGIEPFAV